MKRSIKVAVNSQLAEPRTVLYDGDEVALLPPVAGG
jgi:molybdopterin converting factor small subunit